jgi:hypothetical protein
MLSTATRSCSPICSSHLTAGKRMIQSSLRNCLKIILKNFVLCTARSLAPIECTESVKLLYSNTDKREAKERQKRGKRETKQRPKRDKTETKDRNCLFLISLLLLFNLNFNCFLIYGRINKCHQ